MNSPRPVSDKRTVGIAGGGFTGSLLALKLSQVRPDWLVLLIEPAAAPGRGLAYGACGPEHLLNVPVCRMEVGLAPSFGDWLKGRPALLAGALEESAGRLDDSFVARQLFGDYLEERIREKLSLDGRSGVRRVQGRVASLSDNPRRLVLEDGRALPVDMVVLATGHEPSRLPQANASENIINDPWSPGAFSRISSGTSLLLVGSGLTAIDVLLALRANGHAGSLHMVSRHGLLPRAHRTGGAWLAFLGGSVSPREALRSVRAQVRQAAAQGVPWQRVFDAARPVVASLWHRWSIGQRAQFLRHLRTLWDVHRHRMAGRIATVIDGLVAEGTLAVIAGRILVLDQHAGGITAIIRPHGEKLRMLEVGAVINCTGPLSDLRKSENTFLRHLMSGGRVRSDHLGLGLDTEDSAVRNAEGDVSEWLYALGPLTRPSWWEVTAVPEINAQIDRLVRKLSGAAAVFEPLAAAFLDIGAGI